MPKLYSGAIERLILVAGPSGAGKSTFLSEPERYLGNLVLPPELADFCELARQHGHVSRLHHAFEPRFDALCLHVDITVPIQRMLQKLPKTRREMYDVIRPDLYHDWERLMAYAQHAEVLDIVTLFVSREENRRRWHGRKAIDSNPPFLRQLASQFLDDGPQADDLHRRLYQAWVEFCADLEPRSHQMLDANGPDYALMSQAAIETEIGGGRGSKPGAQRKALHIEWNDPDTLVIAATDLGMHLSMPVDRFFDEAGLSGASRIVICDPSFRMSLGGLPPDFSTFDDLLENLRKLLAAHPHRQVICTGTSGGGHTALLLGHLLKADKVVVFAPYPYLSPEESRRRKDPDLVHMARVLEKLESLPEEAKRYRDLPGILSEWNGKTEYFVHVSRYNVKDRMKADSMRGLPHLRVMTYPFSEHGIALMLRKVSRLRHCFVFPYRRPWLACLWWELKYAWGWLRRRNQRPAARS